MSILNFRINLHDKLKIIIFFLSIGAKVAAFNASAIILVNHTHIQTPPHTHTWNQRKKSHIYIQFF